MKSFILNLSHFCSLGFLLYILFYIENPTNHQLVICIFSAMVIIVCSLERAVFTETIIIKKYDDREEYKGNDDNEE